MSLIWLLKVRNNLKMKLLRLLFNRSRTSISKYLKIAGPKWHTISLNLCQLDISADFAKQQMPQEFIDANMTNVFALNDGKDYKSETVRIDSFYTRAGYSAKTSCNAFRGITYSLPYGLVFLVSPLYFARATEGSIVTILGRDDVVKL
jgi:hypothetical protein